MSKGGIIQTASESQSDYYYSETSQQIVPPKYLDLFESVLLVIPTLNEETTIGTLLDDALDYLPPKNIVVIDGKSEDNTEYEVISRSVPFYTQSNKGKGAALIESMERYLEKFDVLVFIDGDMTYHLEDLEELVKPILEEDYDMVIGDRLRGDREEGAITTFNLMGNWVFSILIKLLHGGELTDTQTGYRALSKKTVRELLPHLNSVSFEIETEMNIIAERKKLDVKTVPIKYTNRPDGSDTKLNPIKVGWRILRKIFELKLKSIN